MAGPASNLMLTRGGRRYVKLVVLLYIEPTKNVGGAKGCILSNLPKVGGAIAPPAPPVPPPLLLHLKFNQKSNCLKMSIFGFI